MLFLLVEFSLFFDELSLLLGELYLGDLILLETICHTHCLALDLLELVEVEELERQQEGEVRLRCDMDRHSKVGEVIRGRCGGSYCTLNEVVPDVGVSIGLEVALCDEVRAHVGYDGLEGIVVEEVGDFIGREHVVDDLEEELFLNYVTGDDEGDQLVDCTCAPVDLVDVG